MNLSLAERSLEKEIHLRRREITLWTEKTRERNRLCPVNIPCLIQSRSKAWHMSVSNETCPEASRVFEWTRLSTRKRSWGLCVVLQYRFSRRSYRASSVRGRSTRAGYLVETRLKVESAGHFNDLQEEPGKRSLCFERIQWESKVRVPA